MMNIKLNFKEKNIDNFIKFNPILNHAISSYIYLYFDSASNGEFFKIILFQLFKEVRVDFSFRP